MRTAALLTCCLVFPLVGTVQRTGAVGVMPRPPNDPIRIARRAPLESLLREGRGLLSSGRRSEAENRFEFLSKSALALKEYDLAARGKGNAGACQFLRHEYQTAVRSFLEAHRLAELGGDPSGAAIFEANLASIYSEMGEVDTAVQWTARSLDRLSGRDRREHLAEVQIQMASLRARQQNLPEALALFRAAIETAGRARDFATYAVGWNRLGEELLRAEPRQISAAESAFLEAFRVRSLHGLPVAGSYTNLARARLESGDIASADALADRAVELSATPNTTPARDVFRLRGQVRIRQNRLAEALDDLRIAIRLERAWRWSAPAADSARVAAEGVLADACAALIQAGNLQYLRTGDRALIRETFEAAEENRASSLRLLRNTAAAGSLPDSYWDAISRLQRAEVAALQNPSAAPAAQTARAALTRMEAGLDSHFTPPPQESDRSDLLGRVAAALDSESALLSFHLQDTASWLWVVDRDGLALYRLPARPKLAAQLAAASAAIRDDTPAAESVSVALYQALFGQLPARFRHKRRWLLALDADLWNLPVAALIDDSAPPAYLAERHTIEIIPGAGAWLEAHHRRQKYSDLFVGVGDPIFNRADPRLTKAPAANPAAILSIPRLVASGKEIESCARAWNGERVLLQAADATRQNLLSQLRRKPAAVHLATHFLQSVGPSPSAMIVLGLDRTAGTPVLPAMEIARLKIETGVVVLSGCDSAAGPVLPSTGLLGLTRAWLSAGAGAVVASRWPTPDDEGEIFRSLYRQLSLPGVSGRPDPAAALQSAQIAMLHSGGWRARPSYWGAWFVMGAE